MPLGYRTSFSVPRDPDPISLAREQLRSWLISKGFTGELPDLGRARLNDAADVTVLEREHSAQSRTWRARLRERNDAGRWVTSLTVHRGGGDSWVLLEIDAPAHPDGTARWTGVPRLARQLLAVMDARDSHAMLTDRPVIAGSHDVDGLIDAICDPDRRALLVVAGTHETLPMPGWTELAAQLTRPSVGMVAAYVLTPEATALLDERIGASHAVAPGTIRTYLPEADPASSDDARRHRWLGTATLVNSDERGLGRALSRVYRQRVLETPLPSQMARVGRALDSLEVDLATEGRLAGTDLAASPVAPPDAEPELPEVLEAEQASAVQGVDGEDAAVLVRLQQLGLVPADVAPDRLSEALQRLVVEFDAARRAASAVTELREVIDDRDQSTQEGERRLAEVQRQFDDTQIELALAEDERRELAEKTRLLEGRLASQDPAGFGEVLASDTSDRPPESYTALVAAISDLAYVEFTGDADITVGLSIHDPADTFIPRIWDAARALDDYARGRAEGAFTDGGLRDYLISPPTGYRGWPMKRYAPTESETVRNDRQMSRMRVFPVPARVHREERIEMWAHMKIAQRGLLSPRMHFLDNTQSDGKVYIGYVGPHLETKSTN